MLQSRDGQFRLKLQLQPILDQAHKGWHSYILTMERADTGEQFTLQSTEDTPLFLDWARVAEVAYLCSGIRSVVEVGGEFIFEPIDEGDFKFHVRREGDSFVVRVTINHRNPSEHFGWPRGVEVEGAELIRFTSELEEQLRCIIQC